MKEIKMTELELSNYMIKQGENGKEQLTKEWIKCGYLNTGKNTYKTFISKVNQYFEVIKVEGRGKKRTYTLLQREKVIKRKLNYHGDIETEEECLMKEYIFNQLLRYVPTQKRNITKTGWIPSLGLPSKKLIKFSDTVIHKINDFYFLKTTQNIKANNIYRVVTTKLNDTSKDILTSSLHKLEKENRIKLHTVNIAYNKQGNKEEYKPISTQLAKQVNKEINIYLAESSIDKCKYILAKRGINPKLKWILEKVNEHTKELFGFTYIFDTFSIDILDDTKQLEVEADEFNAIYFDKLLKSTKKLQNKAIKQGGLQFHDKFIHLNMLLLLSFTDTYYKQQLESELKEVQKYFYINENEMSDRRIAKELDPDATDTSDVKKIVVLFGTRPSEKQEEVCPEIEVSEYVESMLPF